MIEYIFFYKDIIVGGCELLAEKISKEMVQGELRVKVLCQTIDENMSERFQQAGVEFYQLTHWSSNKELCKHINTDHEIRMITFFWEDFVRLYLLKKNKMKTILYVVHYHVLAVGASCRYPLFGKILKAVGAKIIRRLLELKNILCMDEQVIRYTQNYFENRFLDDTSIYKIARIPIDIEDVKSNQLHERAKRTDFNILAIARADFPFKGYLLGLIDFVEEQEDKSNLHLDIISYGPDVDKLKSKIDSLDEVTKRLISLHGKTDYDALGQYYDDAKLYIGMGTTILDAAQRGIISIPVAAYTEELTADKFFHDDYRALAVDEDVDNQIFNLYQRGRTLKPDEYFKISQETRKLVIENYSTERTTQIILGNFEEMNEDKFDFGICLFKWLGFIQRLLH